MPERERYPGYDVLNKRHTPSWNDATRKVIDARLAVSRDPDFFAQEEWRILVAVCDRIMPQPADRPPVPLAGYIDQRMRDDIRVGFRNAALPPQGEAWKRGLHALNAEALDAHDTAFDRLAADQQDDLLHRAEDGRLHHPAWRGMDCQLLFNERIMADIIAAYYAHPTSWNEIGFGGPASPRGYVRMQNNRRDPWEPVEAGPGDEEKIRRKNQHVR